MEYANAGNLEDFMELEAIDEDEQSKRGKAEQKSLTFLEESNVLRIFLEAAQGLQHLHSLGILHRDMKPANLLLNYPRDSATKPTILLSDFGECTEIDHENSVRSGATGTIEFMAPELFRTDTKGTFIHDHVISTDIWSLGMILYYLYFGRLPYSQVEDVDQLKEEMLNIRSVDIPESTREISAPMVHLLERLLSLNPEQRPTLKDVIKAVEGMLLMKSSPKMSSSFSTPMMRAITSENVTLVNPYTNWKFIRAKYSANVFIQTMIYAVGLMQMYCCYPYLPSLKILGLYGIMFVLVNRTSSRTALWSCIFVAVATLVSSLFTNVCAC